MSINYSSCSPYTHTHTHTYERARITRTRGVPSPSWSYTTTIAPHTRTFVIQDVQKVSREGERYRYFGYVGEIREYRTRNREDRSRERRRNNTFFPPLVTLSISALRSARGENTLSTVTRRILTCNFREPIIQARARGTVADYNHRGGKCRSN